MKQHLIPIVILCLLAKISPGAIVAQVDRGSPNQELNPVRPSPDSTSRPANSSQEMQDKVFLRKAAEAGMAEVQFGKLAAEKASGEDVRSFGRKMVDDHTRLNNDMSTIANSNGVSLSKKLSKAAQAEYDKLSALSGEAFDKEYITYTVTDHHADLREFRIEATSTTDPELKAAVDKGAQVIHEHMVHVDKLARDKGIAIPGRGNKSPGIGMK